jgi:predicted DNA-binding transcriptional regulator AlpA
MNGLGATLIREEVMTERKRRYVEPLQDHLLYRDWQVAAIYGCHPITIWNWSAKGIIPRGMKIGPNTTRWSGKAIRLDLEAKAAASPRPSPSAA